MNTLSSTVMVALLCSAAAGCGLISTDVADFDISLPEKTVTIDTQQWQLTGEETFPAIDCSEQAGVCSAATTEVCSGSNCFGSCNAGTETCDVKVLVDVFRDFNLSTEVPALQEVDDAALISVTIDELLYDVSENTFNIDTPEFGVFVAPTSVMSGGAAQAQRVGTIPAIAAGETVTGGTLQMTAEGRERLRLFMEDFTTPFNIIINTEVDIEAGDQVPSGRMTATVKVVATAGL